MINYHPAIHQTPDRSRCGYENSPRASVTGQILSQIKSGKIMLFPKLLQVLFLRGILQFCAQEW